MLAGRSKWWEAIQVAAIGTCAMACLGRMRRLRAFVACRGFKGTPSLVTVDQCWTSKLSSGVGGGGLYIASISIQRAFSFFCPFFFLSYFPFPCGLASKIVHEQHPCCRSKPPVNPRGRALVGWSRMVSQKNCKGHGIIDKIIR